MTKADVRRRNNKRICRLISILGPTILRSRQLCFSCTTGTFEPQKHRLDGLNRPTDKEILISMLGRQLDQVTISTPRIFWRSQSTISPDEHSWLLFNITVNIKLWCGLLRGIFVYTFVNTQPREHVLDVRDGCKNFERPCWRSTDEIKEVCYLRLPEDQWRSMNGLLELYVDLLAIGNTKYSPRPIVSLCPSARHCVVLVKRMHPESSVGSKM